MRIAIVGAGPAGLLFAHLAKCRRPDADVRVVEQNARDATFGFGVVFSHGALEFLARDVPAMHASLSTLLETWPIQRIVQVAIGKRVRRLEPRSEHQRHANAFALALQQLQKRQSSDRAEAIAVDVDRGVAVNRDSDGFYFFEGRADDLIKVSGQWVHPIEVERCLAEHPLVRECAVLALDDENRLKTLVAFVVLHHRQRRGDETTRVLQTFVKERLLPYKYPRRMIYVEALPKTGTGKIDRQALKHVP